MKVPNNMPQPGAPRGINPYPPRPPMAPPRLSPLEPVAPSLPGHYIATEDDIVPGNVPMDGSISFFPYKDLSKIAIRQWNGLGDLEALTYVLEIPNKPEPEQLVSPPQPETQQSQQMVEILNSLNNGLAATFGQFGGVLQSFDQRLNEISQKIDLMPTNDGGMG